MVILDEVTYRSLKQRLVSQASGFATINIIIYVKVKVIRRPLYVRMTLYGRCMDVRKAFNNIRAVRNFAIKINSNTTNYRSGFRYFIALSRIFRFQ